jgi:7-keto-8-aminopelargonate synthetase-like enzyme
LGESQTQIIPLVIGDPRAAMAAAAALRRRGVFAPGIRPPSVPQGRSLVRISLCWPHTQETIDRLVSALPDLR